jgi:Domain of unknown function (DUF4157)
MHRYARVQRRSAPDMEGRLVAGSTAAAPLLHEVVTSPGRPLDRAARLEAETRFGHDFSGVRVHTGAAAAASTRAIGASAYTAGQDVVFAAGQYQPGTPAGQRLLAHELTHVVQQRSAPVGAYRELSEPGDPQERQAEAVAGNSTPAAQISPSAAPGVIQRQYQAPGPVSVRLPAVEEAITQLSDVAGGVAGRPFTAAEQARAAAVFGASIDLARVRLIPTQVLEYRTVGNNIRVPRDFTVSDERMAETLIHELTHVWQYQHGGTSYISHSLQTQIAAAASRGNRNFAYDYEIKPGKSFFDFTPEQQAFIVENYFAMKRDQANIAGPAGATKTYESVHLGPDGFKEPLGATQRTAEISKELPDHERVIAQMRAALPREEQEILLQRASEVIRTAPALDVPRDPTREITPVKPIFELSF